MTDISMSPLLHHDIEVGAGSGHAAPGFARWLGLAAAPTFAIMALWNAFSAPTDMFCMAMRGASPLGGMTMMYLLMCAFHLSPWLKLVAMRRPRRSMLASASSRRRYLPLR